MQHEQPHEAAPQQTREARGEAAADRRTEPEREREPADGPDHERPVNEPHDGIRQQIGA